MWIWSPETPVLDRMGCNKKLGACPGFPLAVLETEFKEVGYGAEGGPGWGRHSQESHTQGRGVVRTLRWVHRSVGRVIFWQLGHDTDFKKMQCFNSNFYHR